MQDILAISIVALAASYLARKAWMRFARKQAGTCGMCSNCIAQDPIKSRPLVNISLDAAKK